MWVCEIGTGASCAPVWYVWGFGICVCFGLRNLKPSPPNFSLAALGGRSHVGLREWHRCQLWTCVVCMGAWVDGQQEGQTGQPARQPNKLKDQQTGERTDRLDRQTYTKTDRWTDTGKEGWTDGQTKGQTDSQTDNQTAEQTGSTKIVVKIIFLQYGFQNDRTLLPCTKTKTKS